MFWYIVICLLMLFPVIVYAVEIERAKRVAPCLLGEKQTKKAQQMALVTACIILAFFMACRSKWVGVDTRFYCEAFTYLRQIDFYRLFSVGIYLDTKNTNWDLNFEPGYRLYNRLLGILFSSQQTITIFNSLAILFLLYRWVKNESCDYMLSIWLYITLGIYQTEMNVARNAIAILLCYNALDYVNHKQFWHYVMIVLLAASFHKSTLLFIPLYFLFRRKIKGHKSLPKWMLYSVLIGLLSLQGLPLARRMMPGLASRYLKTNTSWEAVMVGAVYAALVAFVWLNLNGKERMNARKYTSVGWWFLMLNIFSFALNTQIKYAARLAALFGYCNFYRLPEKQKIYSSGYFR